MVLQFSLVLLIMSVSRSFSLEDDFSNYPRNLDSIKKSIFVGDPQQEIQLDKYWDYDETTSLFFQMEGNNGTYQHILNEPWLGSTTSGYWIFPLQMSRGVREPRELLKPMFKFVGNINGDDAVAYALLVSLAQYLTYSYGVDDRITRMLDKIDIWIIPTINPDDLEKIEAGNCDGLRGLIGTNRSDYDQDILEKFYVRDRFTEREVDNILLLVANNPFVLSGNLQGGAVVASYPFDFPYESNNKTSGITSDNEIFKKLAKDYAARNPMMAPGTACNASFPDGITNGYLWKEKRGSMQDANYIISNCFEVTFHLSCCKYPLPSLLPLYWDANLESMLSFIESTLQGAYGLVTDRHGKPFKDAVVTVAGKEKKIEVTERGEYWRLLLLGQYKVTASAVGCRAVTHEVELTANSSYVRRDFVLTFEGVYGSVRSCHSTTETDEKCDKEAVVRVEGEVGERKVDGGGDFGWVLELGKNYTVTASAPGYIPQTKTVDLTKDYDHGRVDFDLTPISVLSEADPQQNEI